ncbi:MAG: hypothetical protein ACR2QC_07885 [Gammaproteobacteria bacterium]
MVAWALLTGCADLTTYKDAAIAKAEEVNDAEAEIVTRLGCTIDLAAWGRLKDMRVQDGMFYACVPETLARRYGLTVVVE